MWIRYEIQENEQVQLAKLDIILDNQDDVFEFAMMLFVFQPFSLNLFSQ